MKKILSISLILLFSGTRLLFSQNVSVIAEDKTKKIEVVGSAEMKVVPDEIFVSFTLQEYYDKQKTKIDIDRIQKDFLEKCTKANISKDRIEIQNMNGFDPNSWYWRKRKNETPDLMASTTYIIKFNQASEIDRLVNTLDENATKSMNTVRTSHSKIDDFKKEIKIKALQAAKVKAQYLCESIGEKLGKTLYIQEIENEDVAPFEERVNYSRAYATSEAPANEGIDFQKITIRYTIRASFEIQ